VATIIRRRGDRILDTELDIMCQWIELREEMRIRKEEDKAPFPWTKDYFLREYRWCNVRRMDDRVSRWLLDWHRSKPEFSINDRIIAATAGRLINWPDSLAECGYPLPYREARWTRSLLARKARGEKVFTGAYIVNGALGGDKIMQVTQKILQPLWRARMEAPRNPTTMESIYTWMNGKPGIGSFMAGQVVADLRHIHPEFDWTDRYTWAPKGPGSVRGVNRLIGQPLSASLPNKEWLDVVRAAYAKGRARLPHIYLKLELMDQQNVFCEYDKYSRLKKGEGSVRARYRPERR